MKCYLCKAEINKSVRVFMDARNKREKSQYRDLCEVCYPKHMLAEGYVLKKSGNYNIWSKR